jgi:hypothetical protein
MPTCKCKLPHIRKEQVSEVTTIRLVMHIYVQVASCFTLGKVKHAQNASKVCSSLTALS